MADIKISELTSVSSLNNGDLVEVSQVNELAPSGYTSLKATMRDLGDKVNTDIEYTTDLADFTDKTTLGAIKETAKDKNVADEYDDTQTYNKGDVVIYKNTLYICNTNNTTGAWDATKWTATTVQSLIGSLSTLTTTDKSSIVGAVNEVNNAPRPTTNISSARSDIIQWNTSVVPNTRAGTINVFFVFNNTGTAQPMITHTITCSRNILSMSMIGFNMTTGANSASASYDNGNIKWNTGLLQGVYICMGTIVFE